ncbi:MAG: host attachment family protein [Sphingomonadaceae bacterium]
MRVTHNTLVLVADGRKMLLLRNAGDVEHLRLELEDKAIHENPKDSEQKSDAAGRASSTQSGPGAPRIAQAGALGQGAGFAPSRGSMDEPDYHALEEERFAAEMADMVNRRALSNDFDRLIVVAPARTLGELRKHFHQETNARLVGEIEKDLTNHPVPEIEEALTRA